MVLKELADEMMKPLSVIFKKSWTKGEVPKTGNVKMSHISQQSALMVCR
jgi:hypothetical protein